MQKTPGCSGLPAEALVQDVVMGRKGKTEVGRAWCEPRWLGGLALLYRGLLGPGCGILGSGSPSPVMERSFLSLGPWLPAPSGDGRLGQAQGADPGLP